MISQTAEKVNNPSVNSQSPIVDRLGYLSLILLAIVLPFELTQVPLVQLPPFFVLSNLEIVFYICTALAVVTLGLDGWRRWQAGERRPNIIWLAFGLLIIWCCISSVLGSFPVVGLKWTSGMVMGGIVALAMPYWFKTNTFAKLKTLITVLVVTGTISAAVGWLEFILGTSFANSLGWFKTQPTAAGPYLRLSGTFEYANIAAIYYEMMLPLAIVGLALSLRPLLQKQTITTNKVWAGIQVSLWMLAVLVLYEATLLTFSRSALLGTAAALFTLVIAWRVLTGWRRVWTVTLAISGLIILTATAATWVMQPVMGLRFTSQSDQDWYKASYIAAPPAKMSVCQETTVPVTVKNEGPLLWEATIKRPYYLGYHWLNADETVFQYEGRRSPLPANVSQGGTVVIQANLKAPQKPGKYLLVWDMVQQDVSWFSNKIAQYNTTPVEVTPLSEQETIAACQLAPGESKVQAAPAPKVLPKVLAQPNRDQLWKAAVEMIKVKPVLGVGPDNYRLVYGKYSNPKLDEWDERIFANNTPLELAAGIGVVGLLLFVAFAGLLLWVVVKPLIFGFKLSGQTGETKATLSPAQFITIGIAAALAAFIAHGILDYFFGSRPIFYIMWLILGLAYLANSGLRTKG